MKPEFNALEQHLRSVYHAERRKDLFFLLLLTVAWLLLGFAVYFLLDFLTGFPGFLRILLTLLIPSAILYFLVRRKLAAHAGKTDIIGIAREIEQKALRNREGGFQDILFSVVEIADGRGNGSDELRQQIVDASRMPQFDPENVVLHDVPMKKLALKFMGGALGVYLIWLLISPASMGIFFVRCAGVTMAYPARTKIQLVESPDVSPRYEDVTVRIMAAGVLPAKGNLNLKFDSGDTAQVPLEVKEPGEYVATIRRPADSFSWKLKLGDAYYPTQDVRVVKPPEAVSSSVTITAPDYAKRPDTIRKIGSFEALAGSKVVIRLKPDREIAVCEMIRKPGAPLRATLKDGEYVFPAITIKDFFTFTVRMSDSDGIENRDRVEYAAAVTPDTAPLVAMALPESGQFFSEKSIVRYSVKASDDIGMEKLLLKYTILKKVQNGDEVNIVKGESGVINVAELGYAQEVNKQGILDLNKLNMKDGESAEIQLLVSDGLPGRKPAQYGASDTIMVNRVSPAELRKIIDEESALVLQTLADVQSDMKRQRTTVEEIIRKEGVQK